MKQLLSLLLVLNAGCNSAQNNSDNKSDPPETFEINFSQMGVRAEQVFFEYKLTAKKIEVKKVENTKDSTGKFISKTEIVFEKNLAASDMLNEISHISISNFEEVKKNIGDGCEGGMVEVIHLKKNNKECQLVYQCAKTYDDYTKKIVKFINKEVPGKYKIQL